MNMLTDSMWVTICINTHNRVYLNVWTVLLLPKYSADVQYVRSYRNRHTNVFKR